MNKVTEKPDKEAWPNIPGYTILGIAGEGGMGRVYRAEQEATRRMVAIKVLPAKQLDLMTSRSIDPLATFKREAETVAALEHPFILPVYDFGEFEGRPYLVMRYVEGGSVADMIAKNGRIPPKQAYRWIQQIADALDYAHQKDVIHKDVKPSNMLLDESGNAYLTDFGISGVDLGEGKMGIGSASYMPPEQSMGEEVDRRVDVYALAVTLFEMLTGEKPYQAETTMGVIVRHMHDPIPSPHLMNPAISHSVSTLIQWGMAKDPDNRPSSTAEFAALLAVAQANPEVSLRSMPELKAMAVDLNIKLDDKLIMQTATGLRPANSEISDSGIDSAGGDNPPNRSRTLLLIGGVIGAIVLFAIIFTLSGGPTAIASNLFPTDTPIPTATTLPTPTPVPTFTPTPVGRFLADDFSSIDSGFALIQGATGGIDIEAGRILFSASAPAQLLSNSGSVSQRNVDVMVQAAQTEGPEAVDMGIVCRFQDRDNYTAMVVSRQGVALIWQEKEGTQTILQQETVEGLQNPLGLEMELRGVCNGQTLRLFLNGGLVAEAADPNPVTGDVALIALLRGNEPMVVQFDNIVVTQP